MLAIAELAMSKQHKVITVCCGEKKVWLDREEAKDYFLESMMSSDGEIHERYSSVYMQLINGLNYCTD